MNFRQFMETLTKMDIPDDADVIIVHGLIGDEHSLEMVEYDVKRNVVYFKEVFDW